MPNERLRDALLKHGLTPAAIAEDVGVDPKTAERWITQNRTPYPRHRHATAIRLQESESYLWPDALTPERAARIARSEVVEFYPRRAAIPVAAWQKLFDNAQERIGILVYAGLFLPE
jgi:transcriptional regulator with XRE-family HTH domain